MENLLVKPGTTFAIILLMCFAHSFFCARQAMSSQPANSSKPASSSQSASSSKSASSSEPTSSLPVSGTGLPPMKVFDTQFIKYLQEDQIPGAAVTVAYKGKVVFSRGYGYADKEAHLPVKPDSVFRIASLSKPFTAIAILSMIERGKLNLDQKAFVLLSDLKPFESAEKVDRRLYKITIRDLLQMSAGWAHVAVTDPLFSDRLRNVTLHCTTSLRPNSTAVIRNLMQEPLDFDPGTDHVYSNVSYCILGKIVERISGKSIQNYVNELIIEPECLRTIKQGSTLQSSAAEVKYYPCESGCDGVLPFLRSPVSQAYGGAFSLEAALASFGWIGSMPDLVRFVSTFAGENQVPPPLSSKMIDLMLARPSLPCWKEKTEYFGMGFEVQRNKDGDLISFSRHGSLPGSMALVEHQANGISWAAAFNSRPLSYEIERERVIKIIRGAMKELLPALRKSGR